MASKENRKRKISTASPSKPLAPIPTKMKICYNAKYFQEVDKVIHGKFLDSKGLILKDGGCFTLVRYNSEDEANQYYENAYKAQGKHVPAPNGIHMPKKGPLKGGIFLVYKGHHLKPLSKWLEQNKVKNMEENGVLLVIRGIFQGLRTLYHTHDRGHRDLGSRILEGVAIYVTWTRRTLEGSVIVHDTDTSIFRTFYTKIPFNLPYPRRILSTPDTTRYEYFHIFEESV